MGERERLDVDVRPVGWCYRCGCTDHTGYVCAVDLRPVSAQRAVQVAVYVLLDELGIPRRGYLAEHAQLLDEAARYTAEWAAIVRQDIALSDV